MKPLVSERLITEKGDLCPHCGKADTHVGYVCPQIGAIEFDSCSMVKRIEYRPWVTAPPIFMPQASGIPVYTYSNPRPRYEVGAAGVCTGVPYPADPGWGAAVEGVATSDLGGWKAFHPHDVNQSV